MVNTKGSTVVVTGGQRGLGKAIVDEFLQRGAAKVYAVDVGYGQLAFSLRQDARVVVRERTNAKHLDPRDFAELIDLVVVDASFIGLGKLTAAIGRIVRPGGALVPGPPWR